MTYLNYNIDLIRVETSATFCCKVLQNIRGATVECFKTLCNVNEHYTHLQHGKYDKSDLIPISSFKAASAPVLILRIRAVHLYL